MKTIKPLSKSSGFIVVVSMLFMLATVCAYAQSKHNSKSRMVAKLTRYEVKKDYQKQFRKALSNYVLQSLMVENNILSEAYYEQKDTTILWLIERWENSSALYKFTSDPSSKAIAILAKEAVVQAPKIFYLTDLEPLSKQEWRRTAKQEDDPFTIMLFVDAKPGTQQTFKDVYHTAMPKFRSEEGVITYQLSQLQEDDTQFVTYEKFRNEDAFQYHLKFTPIQPVLDYLNTSIKKQPFQAGLHRLIKF